MAGFLKVLTVEKGFWFQSNGHGRNENQCPVVDVAEFPSDAFEDGGSPDTILPLPQLPQMHNQTFVGIERQFEELHDQFRLRSSASAVSKQYKAIEAKPSPLRTKRHVDVLEAIFSSHRYRVSTPITPTTLYNEDIADRNLKSPSSGIPSNGGQYSRVLSVVYQEDVADRNIPGNGKIDGPFSQYHTRLKWMRSKGDYTPRSRSQLSTHSESYAEDKPPLRVVSSDQDLRVTLAQRRLAAYAAMRPGSAVPSLSDTSSVAGDNSCRRQSALSEDGSSNHVEVPSPASRSPSINSKAKTDDQPKPISIPRVQVVKPSSEKPMDSRISGRVQRKSVSRKNVRDLSINTELAAPRKAYVKVDPQHNDLQIPTPRGECASIAEIVNSPISEAPSPRPSPMPPSYYNVEEMLNLLKQAYTSSNCTSPHPTFESLQDAIVREINSHDAFQQIYSNSSTAPGLSPDQGSFDLNEDSAMSRSSSKKSRKSPGKQRLQSKYGSGKSTDRRPRRNSDIPGRESMFPAIKGLDRSFLSLPKKKRRHTYAQPPSLQLLESYHCEGRDQISVPPLPSDLQGSPEGVSANPSRPHSSHGLVSKTVAAILDPSESTRRSHVRISLRSSSRQKAGGNRKSVGSPKEDLSSPPPQQPQQPTPEIQVDHPSDEEQDQQSAENKAASPVVSSSPLSLPTPIQPLTIKKVRSLSPITSVGKKIIPLRRSSIQKDLFDSGRFRL